LVDVGGLRFVLAFSFADTAGQERFRKSMIQHYYRGVHAVVFVYDVTSPASFDSLPVWIAECEKYHLTSAVPRILIGNKVDMGIQQVPTNRAQKFADAHNMPVNYTEDKREFI
jgi:Ras-related protein Rab-33B